MVDFGETEVEKVVTEIENADSVSEAVGELYYISYNSLNLSYIFIHMFLIDTRLKTFLADVTEAAVETEQFIENEVKDEVAKAEEALISETVDEIAKAAEGIEAEIETVAEQVEKVVLEEAEQEAEKVGDYVENILEQGKNFSG